MRLTRCLLRYGGKVTLVEVNFPPGGGVVFYVECIFQRLIPMQIKYEKKKRFLFVMRQPGIEPGSTAWKAAMLTTIPLTLTRLEEDL